jgi:hypothetical protein
MWGFFYYNLLRRLTSSLSSLSCHVRRGCHVNNLFIGGEVLLITIHNSLPYPGVGAGYPLPPPVSPLTILTKRHIWGIIPDIKQKNFWVKINPSGYMVGGNKSPTL